MVEARMESWTTKIGNVWGIVVAARKGAGLEEIRNKQL